MGYRIGDYDCPTKRMSSNCVHVGNSPSPANRFNKNIKGTDNFVRSCGGRPFASCNSLPSCEYCWTAGSDPTSPGECVPAGSCNDNSNHLVYGGPPPPPGGGGTPGPPPPGNNCNKYQCINGSCTGGHCGGYPSYASCVTNCSPPPPPPGPPGPPPPPGGKVRRLNQNQTYNSRSTCGVLNGQDCLNDPRCQPCSYRNPHTNGPAGPTFTSCVPVGQCMGDQSQNQVQGGTNQCPKGTHWMPPTNGRAGYCMSGNTHPSLSVNVGGLDNGNTVLSCGGRPPANCNSLPSCEYCYAYGSTNQMDGYSNNPGGQCVPAGSCGNDWNHQVQSGNSGNSNNPANNSGRNTMSTIPTDCECSCYEGLYSDPSMMPWTALVLDNDESQWNSSTGFPQCCGVEEQGYPFCFAPCCGHGGGTGGGDIIPKELHKMKDINAGMATRSASNPKMIRPPVPPGPVPGPPPNDMVMGNEGGGCGPGSCGKCDSPNYCRPEFGYYGTCVCYGGQSNQGRY